MIQNLKGLLENVRQPGVSELCRLLGELLEAPDLSYRLIGWESLQLPNPAVFRLRFECGAEVRSLIVKRLEPRIGQRNELAMKRWLPAVGLAENVPALLGIAAERNGLCVWHVYEDLGASPLAPEVTDWPRVEAVIDLIAKIHRRFADHPLLPEVRLHGGDLGIQFYTSNVKDAIHCLEAIGSPEAQGVTPQLRSLCDRLLDRLHLLMKEGPERANLLAQLGGPETLLHGDLWTSNTFVVPGETGLQARLIDWDHAAAGPGSYDLSTFLLRFPREHRQRIFELYLGAVRRIDWAIARPEDLNRLFETHELARIANRIIWPAIAVIRDRAEWGFEMLAEIERWFETMDQAFVEYNETSTEEVMSL
ncbi:MAG TPA: aminoglycoside phosphotransferase family protein [Bacteroidota bacterium]|jgi:thiamine kinase-like enzyme